MPLGRCHNSITSREHEVKLFGYTARSCAAEREAVVIPGSRGSISYLVKRWGDGESRGWSLLTVRS